MTSSLRSILGANVSEIDYTFYAPGAVSRITFDYKQSPWKALSVYVDGVELLNKIKNNGVVSDDWTSAEIIIFGEGEKIIEFKGYTDESVFSSPDTIWIDNLKIVNIMNGAEIFANP